MNDRRYQYLYHCAPASRMPLIREDGLVMSHPTRTGHYAGTGTGALHEQPEGVYCFLRSRDAERWGWSELPDIYDEHAFDVWRFKRFHDEPVLLDSFVIGAVIVPEHVPSGRICGQDRHTRDDVGRDDLTLGTRTRMRWSEGGFEPLVVDRSPNRFIVDST
jgi:hypothetical protein